MSGKILIGLGVVGVGWVALHSCSAGARDRALTVVDAKEKVDVDELNVSSAVSEIAGAVSGGFAGTTDLGGTPIEGTQTGAPVVAYSGPSGESGINIQDDKPSGGTDPSATPATSSPPFWQGAKESTSVKGRTEDSSADQPTVWAGDDVQALWMTAVWGPSGENGLTPSQISKSYALSGPLGGEIF